VFLLNFKDSPIENVTGILFSFENLGKGVVLDTENTSSVLSLIRCQTYFSVGWIAIVHLFSPSTRTKCGNETSLVSPTLSFAIEKMFRSGWIRSF